MFLRICRVIILGICWGILGISAIVTIIALAMLFWTYPMQSLIATGIIVAVCAALVGLIIGKITLKDYYDDKNEGVIKKPSLFVEFIKAKKAGICPRLLWKEDQLTIK